MFELNAFSISLIFVLIAGVILFCYNFLKMTKKEQINKIKEWLLYAVAIAEKELGAGTGQLKLRYVYDMFLAKFPYLSKVLTFKTFSNLVDEVLSNLKYTLNTNVSIKNYVLNEEKEE